MKAFCFWVLVGLTACVLVCAVFSGVPEALRILDRGPQVTVSYSVTQDSGTGFEYRRVTLRSVVGADPLLAKVIEDAVADGYQLLGNREDGDHHTLVFERRRK